MDKILPYILATLTQKKRYRPEIKWSSNSWTHNIFRVYELLFWRRVGIRAELSSYPYEGGTLYICHSWESVFALTETKVREFLKGLVPKFKIVSVPQFAGNNGINVFNSPYLFAIAFDSASSADGGIATTNTYSHTCTGSDLTLTTAAVAIQSPAVTVTATYAAASMTSGVLASLTFERLEIFYLANPATGANNVVTTTSASARNYGGSISMTGTDTSSALGNTNTASGTSTTPSVALTTGTANSWVINSIRLNDTIANMSPSATGTGQTSRYQITHAAGGISAVGSTQTTTSAGSYTSSWSVSISSSWFGGSIEIKPAAPTSAIKTIDGLAKASVKTVNGLAIASVKTWNGLA